MGSNPLTFKEWAANEGIITSAALEQLRKARIGIDADDYLRTLLTASPPREPLLPALGGLPLSFYERIDEDLERFREAGIQPVFIFNGLDYACKDRTTILRESRKASSTLNEAWNVYGDGKGEEAVLAFGKACQYTTPTKTQICICPLS